MEVRGGWVSVGSLGGGGVGGLEGGGGTFTLSGGLLGRVSDVDVCGVCFLVMCVVGLEEEMGTGEDEEVLVEEEIGWIEEGTDMETGELEVGDTHTWGRRLPAAVRRLLLPPLLRVELESAV